jgi:hypothetical protein
MSEYFEHTHIQELLGNLSPQGAINKGNTSLRVILFSVVS